MKKLKVRSQKIHFKPLKL